MSANSKVNRAVGLSLAAAVAGTLTLVPVAKADTTAPGTEPTTSKATVVATEDTTSPSASAPASDNVTTTTVVADTPKASSSVAPTTTTTPWADILADFAALIVPKEATGSGTSGAEFTSDGQTYKALASNPTNGRLYAISDEGHLLRIHPQTGNLKDLGKIPNVNAEGITSATFTNNGTLVLIDGDSVYTKDLANDPTGATAELKNLEFAKKDIDSERTIPALAWAPTGNDDELVALSVNDGKPTLRTLDLAPAKAAVVQSNVDVEKGVDLAEVGAFEFAYLDGDATLFADGEGNAVKLEDGKIVAVQAGRTQADNYKAVAGLQPKPATSSSVAPAAPAEPAPARQNSPSAPQAAPEVVRFKAVVKTAQGGNVSGATFTSPDGTVAGQTGEDGVADIALSLSEAARGKNFVQLSLAGTPNNWGNAVAVVERGAETVTFTLPAGENATATTTVNKPAPKPSVDAATNVIEFDILVRTADNKVIEGAEFKSTDGRVLEGITRADGTGRVKIGFKDGAPKDGFVQLTLKEAPKGYDNAEIHVPLDATSAEIVLPRDPKATPSSTLSRPDQVLKAINDIKPIASSFLAPAAAIAGTAGIAGQRGTNSTRTTFAGTSVTTSTTTRATGRSTSVKPSATVVTRAGKATAVAKANTSTRATASDYDSDERDGDLADTGTPMRAIIALGVLAMLIGGAYLALGRRRENA